MSRIGATTALADPELMSFDTEFWREPIARADRAHPDVDRWAADNTVGLMWLLVPSDRPEEAQAAEAQGWRFMDVRVELDRALTGWPLKTSPDWYVRSHQNGDVDALAGIARDAHRITRFYADPSLSDERCDDLYEHWLRNSCGGWAAKVFVALLPDPVGYVTLHVNGGVGTIGLIATDPGHRRAGMGGALMYAAAQWCFHQGLDRMTVVTQGRNIAAQRLFQKCGFRTTRTDLWFHRRFS